jgi:hypothetical protein
MDWVPAKRFAACRARFDHEFWRRTRTARRTSGAGPATGHWVRRFVAVNGLPLSKLAHTVGLVATSEESHTFRMRLPFINR